MIVDPTIYYSMLDTELASYHGFTVDKATFDITKLIVFSVTFDRADDPNKEGTLKAISQNGLTAEQLEDVSLNKVPILYHCEFFPQWLQEITDGIRDDYADRMDLFTQTGKMAFDDKAEAQCVYYNDGISKFYYAVNPGGLQAKSKKCERDDVVVMLTNSKEKGFIFLDGNLEILRPKRVDGTDVCDQDGVIRNDLYVLSQLFHDDISNYNNPYYSGNIFSTYSSYLPGAYTEDTQYSTSGDIIDTSSTGVNAYRIRTGIKSISINGVTDSGDTWSSEESFQGVTNFNKRHDFRYRYSGHINMVVQGKFNLVNEPEVVFVNRLSKTVNFDGYIDQEVNKGNLKFYESTKMSVLGINENYVFSPPDVDQTGGFTLTIADDYSYENIPLSMWAADSYPYDSDRSVDTMPLVGGILSPFVLPVTFDLAPRQFCISAMIESSMLVFVGSVEASSVYSGKFAQPTWDDVIAEGEFLPGAWAFNTSVKCLSVPSVAIVETLSDPVKFARVESELSLAVSEVAIPINTSIAMNAIAKEAFLWKVQEKLGRGKVEMYTPSAEILEYEDVYSVVTYPPIMNVARSFRIVGKKLRTLKSYLNDAGYVFT